MVYCIMKMHNTNFDRFDWYICEMDRQTDGRSRI